MVNQEMPGGMPGGMPEQENPIMKMFGDLGMMIPQLASLPGIGNDLAKRMARVQDEFRSIIEEAMMASQGQSKPKPMQTLGGPEPVPDRSQGMPQGPSGVYR